MKNHAFLTCGVLLILLVSCTNEEKKQFTSLPSSETNIHFANTLKEDTVFNIIEYLYFYNGGGVSAGDINNDGLIDLYFTSNQQANKLYLNKGNFVFEDITDKAGASGIGNWKTGATMADVNNDGLLDMYLCGVGNYKSFNSKNQLLINNGNLTFTDRTDEFGLNFQGLSTQSVFFDFDLDGDLDFYLLNHSVHSSRSVGNISDRKMTDSLAGDRFYRNDFIQEGKKSETVHFTDITESTGIFQGALGYGLGISISDVNMDGYPDIYVSNDFHENDYLYLNQRNGTFKQVLEKSVGHSSRFSMGNDIADFNNDLRPDICSLDMLPRDEKVIKTSAGDDAYEIYKYKLSNGFHYQAARNCLQLSRLATDSSVFFSDIAIMACMEATDWSWSTLFADFDNDGWKDIFITNGIKRRPNDMDYISFISNDLIQQKLQVINKEDLSVIDQMPEGKVSNFIFKNRGDLSYSDETDSWGIRKLSYSNGAAYADLDNDGDLDLIVNNLNEPASILRNNSLNGNNFLRLNLIGEQNKFAQGAKVIAYTRGSSYFYEVSSTRGFLSSVDVRPVIGLGKCQQLDSLIVIWPSGKLSRILNVPANQSLTVAENSTSDWANYSRFKTTHHLLEQAKPEYAPNFKHKENSYNAFNRENLMPHMLTTEGPTMTVGDANGDRLEDVFVGGGRGQSGALFLQTIDSRYNHSVQVAFEADSSSEDTDAAFFDADQDGDQDLIVVAGGQEITGNKTELEPRLYINDGKGNFFKKNDFETPPINASCVKPADFDGDGDVDLFIGASAMPMLYGMSPTSFLLVNQGKAHFQVVTNFAQGASFVNMPFNRPGMIKDAVWEDINKDKLLDLILVGEWVPLTVLIQQPNHLFINQTNEWGLEHTRGWWNTIAAADVDHDGDVDFVAGNLGLNSRLKATRDRPLKMIIGDLDGNGSSDHILVYFNGDKSYPFASRDQLVKQLPYLKKKFLKYSDYKNVILEDIVSPAQAGQTTELKIEEMNSVLMRNEGGKFTLLPLPREAQMAPIEAILVDDVNQDNYPDILLGGNLLAVQTELGPYDASVGLLLLGDGACNFKSMDANESGFFVTGEIRSILKVNQQNGFNYLVSRNNNSIVGFKISKK
jgi:hypothetical protein